MTDKADKILNPKTIRTDAHVSDRRGYQLSDEELETMVTYADSLSSIITMSCTALAVGFTIADIYAFGHGMNTVLSFILLFVAGLFVFLATQRIVGNSEKNRVRTARGLTGLTIQSDYVDKAGERAERCASLKPVYHRMSDMLHISSLAYNDDLRSLWDKRLASCAHEFEKRSQGVVPDYVPVKEGVREYGTNDEGASE